MGFNGTFLFRAAKLVDFGEFCESEGSKFAGPVVGAWLRRKLLVGKGFFGGGIPKEKHPLLCRKECYQKFSENRGKTLGDLLISFHRIF